MQTALCYLEAIRPKVPESLLDEKLGINTSFPSTNVGFSIPSPVSGFRHGDGLRPPASENSHVRFNYTDSSLLPQGYSS